LPVTAALQGCSASPDGAPAARLRVFLRQRSHRSRMVGSTEQECQSHTSATVQSIPPAPPSDAMDSSQSTLSEPCLRVGEFVFLFAALKSRRPEKRRRNATGFPNLLIRSPPLPATLAEATPERITGSPETKRVCQKSFESRQRLDQTPKRPCEINAIAERSDHSSLRSRFPRHKPARPSNALGKHVLTGPEAYGDLR